MGAGAEHFVQNGLEEILRADGHETAIDCIEPKTDFRAEIKTAFELYAKVSERVAAAKSNGRFPLILSGNCGSTLGAIAGAGTENLGIVWFDAHGDFNTPETTESGFLDGMGLAVAAGLCWKKMAASIPNFRPVAGEKILHVGGRDFDSQERILFRRKGVTVIDAAEIKQRDVTNALHPAIENLKSRVSCVHLHIDLDVLDPAEAPANEYATPGGLGVEQSLEAVNLLRENFKIVSLTIAAYDPKCDPEGKTRRAGFRLMRKILTD
jgi:arginase